MAALAAISLYVAACASKEPTAPSISLSSAEVFILGDELGSVMNSASFARMHASRRPVFSVVPGPSFDAMTSVNTTVTCPSGGNALVTGTASSTTATATVDVTYAFNGCRTAHYTTGGSVRVAANVSSTATTFSLQVTFGGTLSLTHMDGRSGSCKMDFSVNASVAQTDTVTKYTAQGTACGQNVSGTY